MVPHSPQPEVRLSLPARAENVAVVRHVMGAFGAVTNLPGERLCDVRLAVTEACTNVVRHAYDAPDGAMDVRIRPCQDGLEVVVSDSGRGMGLSPDQDGPGYGLPMLAQLTDALAVDRELDRGSAVTMVFRSPRDPSHAEAA